MSLVNLVYRSYKENVTPLSGWYTGTMKLVEVLRCEEDIPDKKGLIQVCGHDTHEGMRLFLLNQQDGKDGLWDVRVDEWKYAGPTEECVPLTYDTEKFTVGAIPELEQATYVGTLVFSNDYAYTVSYAWARWKEAESDPDYYMVKDPAKGEWDLYALDGKAPDTVDVAIEEWIDTHGQYNIYSLPVARPDYSRELPEFSLSPSTFTIPENPVDRIAVGVLKYNHLSVGKLLDVLYDGECEDDLPCPFWFEGGDDYTLYTSYSGGNASHEQYEVPAYIRYTDADTGMEREERIAFTVHGFGGCMSFDPYVKYVRNLASRVGTSELVTILGGNFTEDLNVRLVAMDAGHSVVIPHSELTFGEEAPWQTISFMMSPDYAVSSRGDEQCAVYDLEVGYGDANGFTAVAGTGDAKMALENNIGLIRYKYDTTNAAEQNKASAGAVKTTNSSCFYTSDVALVYDSVDSSGNPSQAGGVPGKYGKTMYVRMNRGQDCEKMLYVRVKAKLNTRLDYRHGEMTINGMPVREGDIVWLDGQKDGETDGLWVVQTGDWIGLKSYAGIDRDDKDYNPCTDMTNEPLPVDNSVLVDLGAKVSDKADLRCTEDVPVKYGTQQVCGRLAEPGMRVLLSNQSDGKDGLWEVTCADWVYWGPVDDTGTTTFDMSGDVLVQNDIDFCACRDGRKNTIFNIEYYYLNAGCYLATANRKVKLICSGLGSSLVPNNNLIITDYSITIGAEPSLVTDTHSTAGDPEPEDCTREVDTFDIDHRNATQETRRGCGEQGTPIKAPTCEMICDCERYYNLPASFDGTSVKSGYSIVFWEFGDGGWHLYSYNKRMPVAYDVYHLHVRGIASPDMVDENTDVYLLDEKNLPTSERTKDAWFVPHGGKVSDKFSMYDPKWKFKVVDEQGELVGWTDILGPDTLYQAWAIHGGKDGTRILAHGETVVDPDTGEEVVVPVGAKGIYGFKFYDSPLTLQRFCDIYNKASTDCIFQDTGAGLVTDQEYPADGGTEPAYIATDDGEIITPDGDTGTTGTAGTSAGTAGSGSGSSMSSMDVLRRKIRDLEPYRAESVPGGPASWEPDPEQPDTAAMVAASVPSGSGRITVRLPLPSAGTALESTADGVFGVRFDPTTMYVDSQNRLAAIGGGGGSPSTGLIYTTAGFGLGTSRTRLVPGAAPVSHGVTVDSEGNVCVPQSNHWVTVEVLMSFTVTNAWDSRWRYRCCLEVDGMDYPFYLDTTEGASEVERTVTIYSDGLEPKEFPITLRRIAESDETEIAERGISVECMARVAVRAS